MRLTTGLTTGGHPSVEEAWHAARVSLQRGNDKIMSFGERCSEVIGGSFCCGIADGHGGPAAARL